MAFRISHKNAIVPIHVLYATLLMTAFGDLQGEVSCGSGEFLSHDEDDQEVCLPCREDMFMPYEDHRITSCRPCTKVEPFLNEYTIQGCTSASDTIVGCDTGYYRRETGDPTLHTGGCYRCTDCKLEERYRYETRACSDKEDTVCCQEPGMVVGEELTAMGRYKCVHADEDVQDTGSIAIPQPDGSVLRFDGCKQNEYMDSYNPGNQAVFCKPCEKGTYSEQENHMLDYCKPCYAEDGNSHLGCDTQYSKEETTPKMIPEEKEEHTINVVTNDIVGTEEKESFHPTVNYDSGLEQWEIILIVIVVLIVLIVGIVVMARQRRIRNRFCNQIQSSR